MAADETTLTAAFADADALRRAWRNDVAKGRLAVADDPSVALLTPVSVVIVLGGRELVRLDARTVHRGGGWLGLQVEDVPEQTRALVEDALAAADRPAPAVSPPSPVSPGDDGPPTEKATADARPIALRYPEMSPPEKMQIALRGDRDGRLMVLKEANPNLVKFLLQNPRTTPQEVAVLAANPASPLDLLKMISEHPMVTQNEAIRVALVKNPRAPVPLVKQHLEKLSHGQLAQLGKSQHLRDEVRRLALKLVLDRH